jgi:hypothetical protein
VYGVVVERRVVKVVDDCGGLVSGVQILNLIRWELGRGRLGIVACASEQILELAAGGG